MLGRTEDCLAALDQAEAALSRYGSTPMERRPRAPHPAFPAPFDVLGEIATSMSKLGRADVAESRMLRVMESIDPTLAKAALWFVPTLASIHVQRENPEEAVRLVIQAVTGAAGLDYKVTLNMAIDVRRDLEPYRDSPAIRELDEHLSLVGAGA
jgi:hypothetical protein